MPIADYRLVRRILGKGGLPNERRTATTRLRCAVVLGALLLWLPALSLAGPIVTLKLKDGRKMEADIQWFFEGRFSVRDVKSDETIEMEASNIKVIDFGEVPRETGAARPLTLAEVRLRAEKQRFPSLLVAFSNLTAARLKDLDSAIRQELERTAPALSPNAERDMSLAHVLALWAMGREDNARALFAKIRADHPTDSVVRQFDAQMRNVKQWAVEPPLPLPEKRP
jgi:hypothetical protein